MSGVQESSEKMSNILKYLKEVSDECGSKNLNSSLLKTLEMIDIHKRPVDPEEKIKT
jgi:hypothetical protein